ncbi:S-layer homology domain-containing protein [Rossellomorea vietnamensis]|uniref:S-layer homology domain-containing protein n=1 Tax=Rossellomorea vietnamensis TaxID=218284 RepID=A0A5D4K8Q5_9BACI|nr:S-layer homology domain-containing protein [Rossellomorea vietnamensis]TYR73416.1 S-layer homology domain-containing protein [Rossellomorea vietnamensis]
MKKLTITFAAAALSLSIASGAKAEFQDVTQFKEEISYLEARGIINGHEDGTFKPENNLKRIHAVQIFLREMNITNFDAPDPGLADMQPGDYGYEEVSQAVELGFISGKIAADGTKYFDPSGFLTRAEMAKMMTDGYNLTADQRISFIDVPMLHWANQYVNRLATANITNGFPDSEFKPNQSISRQHFAAFMARLLDDRFKAEMNHPSFEPDHSKTYVYKQGRYTSSYTHSHDDLWKQYDVNTGSYADNLRPFSEAANGIVFGKPQMSFSFTLGYPVKTGHKWMDQNALQMTITSTDSTITTPAGTFTNAVEVRGNGYLEYYAPNVGLVKSTYLPYNDVIAELIEIK